MAPSRLIKSIVRRARVSWREQPTQQDIEALQANISRVGLVIRVRWALVAVLAIYSVIGGAVYLREVTITELMHNMLVPAVALMFVLAYNTFYQSTYRRLGNISFLNHAQLLFDMVVVTVLVYYSGGVYSWFPTMYLLIILEGAFILPNRRHVWFLAVAGAVMYGALLWSEYFGLLPHVPMPFMGANALAHRFTYVTVRYMWQITVMFGTAVVSSLLVGSSRAAEESLRERVMIDSLTGLYNRRYFRMALAREVERAQRSGCNVTVILADVDAFAEYNRLFGIEAGDRMLCAVTKALLEAAESSVGAKEALDTVSRYGGEEFAIIVADSGRRLTERRDPHALAEDVRTRVARLALEGSVTVSVGMATFPHDGNSESQLLAAADSALSSAEALGGNRVVVANPRERRDTDERAG